MVMCKVHFVLFLLESSHYRGIMHLILMYIFQRDKYAIYVHCRKISNLFVRALTTVNAIFVQCLS
jgi:hypothetical protein